MKIERAENNGECCLPNTKYRADGHRIETKAIYQFHVDYCQRNPKTFYANDSKKRIYSM